MKSETNTGGDNLHPPVLHRLCRIGSSAAAAATLPYARRCSSFRTTLSLSSSSEVDFESDVAGCKTPREGGPAPDND